MIDWGWRSPTLSRHVYRDPSDRRPAEDQACIVPLPARNRLRSLASHEVVDCVETVLRQLREPERRTCSSRMSRRFERLHEGARAHTNLPTGLLYHRTVRTPAAPLVHPLTLPV